MTPTPRRILIVDDEASARAGVRALLQKRDAGFAVAEAANGVEALARIADFKPEVVFLDVEMPVLSGFDVLLQVEHRDFSVVFATAHSDFAIRAFDEAASDYLLKPFSEERFYRALDRALNRALGQRDPQHDSTAIPAALADAQRYLETLLVKVGDRYRVVDLASVLYFFSEDHLTHVVCPDLTLSCDQSLEFLEHRLNPTHFLRIHRKTLVNRRMIVAAETKPYAQVRLSNGTLLKVAKERWATVRRTLAAGS